MKNIRIDIQGTTTLLMHSPKCVNPLHPLKKAMNKLTAPRKKTDEIHEAVSHLEWMCAAYFNEDISRPIDDYLTKDMYLYIPTDCFMKSFVEGARSFKMGKHMTQFVTIQGIEAAFDPHTDMPITQMWKDPRFRDVRNVTVGRSKVMRTRPRFDKWSSVLEVRYDDTKIDFETICAAVDYAGRYVGVGDFRPKYGLYAVSITELD